MAASRVSSEQRSSLSWWTCAISLSGIVCIHFIATLLYSLPVNPVGLRYSNAVNRWIEPYFTQHWDFFAPLPNNKNYFVLARTRYLVPGRAEPEESGWYNVSSILMDNMHDHRLSPWFQVELGLANAAEDYANYLRKEPAALTSTDGDISVLKRQLPSGLLPAIYEYMVRTSAMVLRQGNPDRHYTSLQVALFISPVPPFSKRTSPDALEVGALSAEPWTPFPVVDGF